MKKNNQWKETCRNCGYTDEINSFKIIKTRNVVDSLYYKSSIEIFALLQCPKCSFKFETQL